VVPHRLHDTLGMNFEVPGRPMPAGVHVYHERQSRDGFGERGLALFNLLLPAFEAGAHAWLALSRNRHSLVQLLDSASGGLAVFDARGLTLQHSTPALSKLLAEEPERERLMSKVRQMAAYLGTLAGSGASDRRTQVPSKTPSSVEFDSATRRYRLRGTLLEAALLGPRATIAVLIERVAPAPPAPEILRGRYHLTVRESEVARLLSEGLTDRALAQALGISRHTARRHTERVLRKMDVHSRAAVGAVIRGR
jgi:non-specific serine/threonine protein kinase